MYRSVILTAQVLMQEGINDEYKMITLRKQIILILAYLLYIESKEKSQTASFMHTIFCLEGEWIRNPFVGNSA